jgi:hypothetical protein
MTPEPRRIPDALLERYLADALPTEAKARLEATLAASSGDQARLAELRADSAAYLLQHPPGPLVARFQEESRRAKWWRRPTLFAPLLAATAAAVVLALLPPTDDPYTVKGSVILVLHRKTAHGSTPVLPGGTVAPHDSIRFEVKGETDGFVAVLSRDPQGTLSVYYPFGGTAAAPYDVGQPLLPGAIELDDTLGREDIYVLHSTRPFDVTWALQALRAGRRLNEAAPTGISVGHASIVKVPASEQQK